jgi:hypothetical protein
MWLRIGCTPANGLPERIEIVTSTIMEENPIKSNGGHIEGVIDRPQQPTHSVRYAILTVAGSTARLAHMVCFPERFCSCNFANISTVVLYSFQMVHVILYFYEFSVGSCESVSFGYDAKNWIGGSSLRVQTSAWYACDEKIVTCLSFDTPN